MIKNKIKDAYENSCYINQVYVEKENEKSIKNKIK